MLMCTDRYSRLIQSIYEGSPWTKQLDVHIDLQQYDITRTFLQVNLWANLPSKNGIGPA